MERKEKKGLAGGGRIGGRGKGWLPVAAAVVVATCAAMSCFAGPEVASKGQEKVALSLPAMAEVVTVPTTESEMPESIRNWKPAFNPDGSFKYIPYKGKKYTERNLSWHPDILPGYEARYVNQGEAYDGPCRATVVRKLTDRSSGRAVLYVHGFNDYFFQKEMGDRYVDSGYNFYAVDLRRYGRSMLPWQYPFDVRDFNEYLQDIDSALSIAQRDGNTDITLIGHSTGGLTTMFYAAERGARSIPHRVVGDSPFLAWNFPAFYRKVLIPVVGFWGRIDRSTKITQSHCDAYAESLLKQYHGEWEYDTCWKMIFSPPVKAAWINAVSTAQNKIMKHGRNIAVPALVMHSSRGYDACSWDSTCMTADIVLDPKEIARRGHKLGGKVEVCAIDSGIHDLILSERPHRDAAYDSIFNFIKRHPR